MAHSPLHLRVGSTVSVDAEARGRVMAAVPLSGGGLGRAWLGFAVCLTDSAAASSLSPAGLAASCRTVLALASAVSSSFVRDPPHQTLGLLKDVLIAARRLYDAVPAAGSAGRIRSGLGDAARVLKLAYRTCRRVGELLAWAEAKAALAGNLDADWSQNVDAAVSDALETSLYIADDSSNSSPGHTVALDEPVTTELLTRAAGCEAAADRVLASDALVDLLALGNSPVTQDPTSGLSLDTVVQHVVRARASVRSAIETLRKRLASTTARTLLSNAIHELCVACRLLHAHLALIKRSTSASSAHPAVVRARAGSDAASSVGSYATALTREVSSPTGSNVSLNSTSPMLSRRPLGLAYAESVATLSDHSGTSPLQRRRRCVSCSDLDESSISSDAESGSPKAKSKTKAKAKKRLKKKRKLTDRKTPLPMAARRMASMSALKMASVLDKLGRGEPELAGSLVRTPDHVTSLGEKEAGHVNLNPSTNSRISYLMTLLQVSPGPKSLAQIRKAFARESKAWRSDFAAAGGVSALFDLANMVSSVVAAVADDVVLAEDLTATILQLTEADGGAELIATHPSHLASLVRLLVCETEVGTGPSVTAAALILTRVVDAGHGGAVHDALRSVQAELGRASVIVDALAMHAGDSGTACAVVSLTNALLASFPRLAPRVAVRTTLIDAGIGHQLTVVETHAGASLAPIDAFHHAWEDDTAALSVAGLDLTSPVAVCKALAASLRTTEAWPLFVSLMERLLAVPTDGTRGLSAWSALVDTLDAALALDGPGVNEPLAKLKDAIEQRSGLENLRAERDEALSTVTQLENHIQALLARAPEEIAIEVASYRAQRAKMSAVLACQAQMAAEQRAADATRAAQQLDRWKAKHDKSMAALNAMAKELRTLKLRLGFVKQPSVSTVVAAAVGPEPNVALTEPSADAPLPPLPGDAIQEAAAPPPPPKSIPPPPPPPPPPPGSAAGGSNASVTRVAPTEEGGFWTVDGWEVANVPMRKLMCLPLRDVAGTVFADLDEAAEDEALDEMLEEVLDLHDLERAFAARAAKPVASAAKSEKSSSDHVELLDPSRARNIDILLSQFKGWNLSQIRNAILEWDTQVLTPQRVRALVRAAPSDAETEVLTEYTGPRASLPRPVKFMYELVSVAMLSERLSVMVFLDEAPGHVLDVSHDLVSVAGALHALDTCTSLMSLLRVVRRIVNFMGGASKSRPVAGFRLSVLTRLADVRAADGSTTLLHYLVERVADAAPHLGRFVQELGLLEHAASKPLTGYIAPNVRVLARDLELVNATLQQLPADDPIVVKARPAVADITDRIHHLHTVLAEANADYARLAIRFGEKADVDAEDFLGVLVRFRAQWIRAEADLERAAKVRDAAAKRAALADTLRAVKAKANRRGNVQPRLAPSTI
ncbi:uncharacterized protein AMSG_09000 [Thecamonas trahens ATCC 50062]|uniref:FH2 domain-containing protein n=1 Tax=Thecamonas trahens ATCC 50062 TaxID=461836 RepID=A0A0L0DKL4_THETB|nr:hypothetical protein AMSG_09000 [Thecamonas trahens ATCC 50062]KNC52852.1 hypothetical protein AMSG_09000 [Thecamonas trahens ATCC 50062]|eukprot:XP_013754954.1 hypothetical protein AMSG_09000 [Thecamonas trahens ATCC 50062]